jgi:hypothetical protein
MKRPVFPVLKYCFIVLALTCAAACQNNKASLSPGTKQLITDSTGHLMTNISKGSLILKIRPGFLWHPVVSLH